ncbi:TetR/AcrR family transcriptional regulator [Sphingomonas sp. PAMC 26621]|uniref:TetR/AcrR family transcriptional regulator n=1 Tax=Sphingomonas sp. PAMC 26621 TaxID=1112213 RepID=UPI0002E88028|nr:TetR/AcrR family transcriptional regulator [Sphingomonas sp. PAMC 26621]
MTTTRGPGRPRDQAKGVAILDAGWALFLERGVGAVSIEAIAARAGVSKMTVYKHFTDKHALFEEAVLREMRAIKTMQIVQPTSQADDLKGALRAFGIGIMSYLATGAAVDFYNVLAGELRRHPDIARTFYDIGPGRTISNLASILAGAGDRLVIDDPIKAAEALFGLWQGASNFQLSLGVDAEGAGQAIAERVDYGIAIFMRAFSRPAP